MAYWPALSSNGSSCARASSTSPPSKPSVVRMWLAATTLPAATASFWRNSRRSTSPRRKPSHNSLAVFRIRPSQLESVYQGKGLGAPATRWYLGLREDHGDAHLAGCAQAVVLTETDAHPGDHRQRSGTLRRGGARRPRQGAEGAAVEVFLRRGRVGSLRGHHRAPRVRPHARRRAAPAPLRGGDRGAAAAAGGGGGAGERKRQEDALAPRG